MNPMTTLDIEVFRAGDYGPRGRFTEEDLEALAARYDPARHEAPVTLDHAQEGAAHGWIEALWRRGDRLLARIGRLSNTLRAALESGAYRKRSIELYRRFGEEAAPYLKAVSFLGAAVPEVKGLADPVFAEGGDGDTVVFAHDGPLARADALRQQLSDAGIWRPEWDARGLREALAAVADSPHFDAFAEALALVPGLVTRGALPMQPESAEVVAFAEELAGGRTPAAGRERHRRAIAWMARHPGASYAEALVAAHR